jgi:hypothetical protein
MLLTEVNTVYTGNHIKPINAKYSVTDDKIAGA